ncbi:DDE-type integrase/transposase/recombinase [Desulfoluna spongiiphila]|uniref:DDE-type integrase/transposase/recombinase n=1 Tax=Desulfoluna spongiiphila TaxID=419481 RepID=UPI000B824F39
MPKSCPPGEATTHCATAPNQVWHWYITYLPGPIKRQYYYFYMILDLFSRKIVEIEVHGCESSENAAQLVHRTVLRVGCIRKPLILHSDNSSPMKGATLREKLKSSSFNHPIVSNGNAFMESLFRTFTYRQRTLLADLLTFIRSRKWVLSFTYWYNLVQEETPRALEWALQGYGI